MCHSECECILRIFRQHDDLHVVGRAVRWSHLLEGFGSALITKFTFHLNGEMSTIVSYLTVHVDIKC